MSCCWPRSPAAARDPDLADHDDVFSALLLARDEDGEGLTDGEVRDELLTLLLAGHETTAAGLAWTFDLLLHEPRVMARASERDDAYLDAVVKEALRIRPVIQGVGRVVRERPFELGGYEIPVGVEINPSIRTIHRRGDLFAEPDALPARALPRPRSAGHLHLDPVRRRHPPLPGRELRARPRCGSCSRGCSSAVAWRPPTPSRPSRSCARSRSPPRAASA